MTGKYVYILHICEYEVVGVLVHLYVIYVITDYVYLSIRLGGMFAIKILIIKFFQFRHYNMVNVCRIMSDVKLLLISIDFHPLLCITSGNSSHVKNNTNLHVYR